MIEEIASFPSEPCLALKIHMCYRLESMYSSNVYFGEADVGGGGISMINTSPKMI